MPSPPQRPAPEAACSVCAADAPPLIGSRLTGIGLTLDQAARELLRAGEPPAGLTPVQVRLVEERAAGLDA